MFHSKTVQTRKIEERLGQMLCMYGTWSNLSITGWGPGGSREPLMSPGLAVVPQGQNIMVSLSSSIELSSPVVSFGY